MPKFYDVGDDHQRPNSSCQQIFDLDRQLPYANASGVVRGRCNGRGDADYEKV
jgi:hypothetical protein